MEIGDEDLANGNSESALITTMSTERPNFLVGDEEQSTSVTTDENHSNSQETFEATDNFNQNIAENGVRSSFDLAEKRRRLR